MEQDGDQISRNIKLVFDTRFVQTNQRTEQNQSNGFDEFRAKISRDISDRVDSNPLDLLNVITKFN